MMKKTNILKKPALHKMFIRNVIIYAIVALCIGYAGTSIAARLYGSSMENELYSLRSDVDGEIFKVYEECQGDEEQFLSRSAFVVHSYSIGGMASFALLDMNEKQALAKSTNSTMFLMAGADSNSEDEGKNDTLLIYSCDEPEITDTIRQAYRETGYAESATYIKMNDFYLQGYTFIPGMVKIMTYGDTEESVLKEMDFTPEDTTGYQHIVMEEAQEYHYGDPILFEDTLSTETLDYMDEFVTSEKWYDELGDCEGGGGGSIGGFGENKCFSFEKLELGQEDEKEYFVLGVSCYNFFEVWKSELLLAYGVLLVATLLIAFITSYTSYMREKAFYEMDQYRRNMTNIMAHDLKSPLMVISGFAENLSEEDLSEKAKHFTNSIMENVQYMNQMIEKVLELSKAENVEYKLKKEAVDLRELTEELIKKYESQLESRGLEIRMSGACTVNADRLCITQILDNLVSNAAKYTMEGSVIEINLSNASYEISNTSAVDFDMDVQDLTKPFVKGDNSRSGKQGSGIGLTIAKNLVEQHGYQLHLECNDGIFVVRIEM